MSCILKYGLYVRDRNFVVTILIFFSLYLLFYCVWAPLYYLILEDYDVIFASTPNETLLKDSTLKIIIYAIILAPLIETLLFQKVVYHILSLIKFLQRHKVYIVLIGAFVFGLIHFYTLSYIIYNFFMGLLFMSAYVIKRGKHGYWVVVVLHALCNVFAVLIEPIEKNLFGG